MSHFEQRLRGETKFQGKIIDVIHDTVLLENGREALREVARHRGAVGIFVMDGDRVVLVRQFRYPIGRELREETGGRTSRLEVLGDYYGSVGFCDEKLTLYFARLEQMGENNPDEDEFLNVKKIPLETAVEMIMSGEVEDAKTQSAILKVWNLKNNK